MNNLEEEIKVLNDYLEQKEQELSDCRDNLSDLEEELYWLRINTWTKAGELEKELNIRDMFKDDEDLKDLPFYFLEKMYNSIINEKYSPKITNKTAKEIKELNKQRKRK